jgi:hypothetical protein
MISRLATIGLVCAGLYAATLGAGAFAPAESVPADPTPAATETAPTPPPATPEPTVDTQPTPFPSPVETVVAPTPEPTQDATPAPTRTAEPAKTPEKTQEPQRTPDATATPGATPSPTATPGAKSEKRPGKKSPNRTQGVAGLDDACHEGELVGSVVSLKASTSTSDRDCVEVEDKDKSDDSDDSDHDHDSPLAGDTPAPAYNPDGSPTTSNPGYTLATPGAAPIGVPNFFIEKFRIPPFLLPIYQAAGIQYGIRWEVLAAINEIETDYGRNLNISSAGALGWMQFMPATWDMYGVDANGDGQKDPFNPVDAIFAAARYLRAAGADQDLYRAIFAYNHADWYVESVLMRARVIGGLPSDLVGSLTGLTQGRFPVQAKSTYAGAMPDSELEKRFEPGQNAARIVESDATRRSIRIFSREKAPVVAVQDGVIRELGKDFVILEDPYGNTYRYSGLAEIAEHYPAPRTRKAHDRELELPKAGKEPQGPASRTTKAASHREPATKTRAGKQSSTVKPTPKPKTLPAAVPSKERLFAHPRRPNAKEAGGAEQLGLLQPDEPLFIDGEKINTRKFVAKPLRKGARVVAGTVLGRIGETSDALGPNVKFEIRPAGRGAPRIDPKPILDGWKLLESTAIYRSKKTNPFFGTDAEAPSIGQIMLMSKDALQRHVLQNPNIEIYECGRQDVRTGQIDRRVLATLEYLASSGLKPTVTSMRCGHGYYTASGNVSEHSTGTALDIGAINGIVITPSTQGKGSITDLTIQRLLTLQGTMKPHQIISLMTFQGTDNTFAMGDHGDHIHVGWRPNYDANSKAARRMAAVLKPDQWIKLIDRISAIDNPVVREQPSRFSVAVTKRASDAHHGE